MLNLNNLQVAGNMTRDAQLKMLPNDKVVAEFGIAINRRYRDTGGEMKEETTYLDVEIFGKQADLTAQYTHKGKNVMLEGSLKYSSWVDKESGKNRSKLTMHAQKIHFSLGNNPDQSQQSNQSQQSAPTQDAPVDNTPVDHEEPF